MMNPYAFFVLTICATALGLGYLIVTSLNEPVDNTSRRRNRSSEDVRRGCSNCRYFNGRHESHCPLAPPKMNNYKVVNRVSTDERCGICLDELRNKYPVARLPCFCLYHQQCIDRWFQESITCPIHRPS